MLSNGLHKKLSPSALPTPLFADAQLVPLAFKINIFLSDDLQGAQSEIEAKQEIQHLRKELIEAQELARASKQKCFELQGEIKITLTLQGM